MLKVAVATCLEIRLQAPVPGSPLDKTVPGLVLRIGVLLLLAPPLTVTEGRLTHPLLVLEAGSQRTGHCGQRSPQLSQSQVLTYAYRVLESALEVAPWHKHPRCNKEQCEQDGVGQEHRSAYAQHGHSVVECRPSALLWVGGTLPQVVGNDDPHDHRQDGHDHKSEQAPETHRVRKKPEGVDRQYVDTGGEGCGYGTLEGWQHLPRAVGEHHPGPQPQVPECSW